MAEKEMTVQEKQVALKKRRSEAERLYRAFVAEHGEKALKPGAGKGKEPKPWCECHNRNPCPIDEELRS